MHLSNTLAAAALFASSIAASTPDSPQYTKEVPTYSSKASYSSSSQAVYSSVTSPGQTTVTSTAQITATSPRSTVTSSAVAPTATSKAGYTNWKTYVANGVNIGCWLELELSCYQDYWYKLGNVQYSPPGFKRQAPQQNITITAQDEWTLCQQLGDRCPEVMNKHYSSFINQSSIDAVAAVGVDTLRIPTTYAAWVDVPGSQFYHGTQQQFLRNITNYAIERYGMKVTIGLHSLPGGVNTLDIGEAFGHDAWFFNQTNLQYSYQAVQEILNFMTSSGHPEAFTISPINEAANNFTNFGTCAGLTTSGAQYVADYINGVLDMVQRHDSGIPVMLEDCFCGEGFWAPFFNATRNLVIDTHVYYFAAAGIYSHFVDPAICGQAATLNGTGKFPVFVGEYSTQVTYNNSLAARGRIFNTQRYAFAEFVHGSTMWNIVHYGNATVDGQGVQGDYWSYLLNVEQGNFQAPVANQSYC